jgi:hypothetical protein
MNTEITMMANILSTGLQAWNVTGSCDETTGTITAEACGKVFGSTFCPSGEFTSECSYNDDYQAAGYQTGCDAPPGKVSKFDIWISDSIIPISYLVISTR